MLMSTITKNHKNRSNNSSNLNSNRLDDLDWIAKKLDQIGRRLLPNHVIRDGILKGSEPEIRQEALIMAVGGYLQNNPSYAYARNKHDDVAVERAMERCMAIALRICKTRMASRLGRADSRMTLLHQQMHESSSNSYPHPSQLHPTDWPTDLKACVIMRSVSKAVGEGRLSLANASMITMICVDGMQVRDVAQVFKISCSAAYQQIRRARRVIPEIIDQVEVSLL